MIAILYFTTAAVPALAGTIRYYYDSLSRLSGVDYSTGTAIAYQYDPAGNITSRRVSSSGDTDADGLKDGFEWKYFGNLGHTASQDYDGDGLTNAQEAAYGTDPTKKDTDGDGYSDKEEIARGSDPNDPLDVPLPSMPWTNLLLMK